MATVTPSPRHSTALWLVTGTAIVVAVMALVAAAITWQVTSEARAAADPDFDPASVITDSLTSQDIGMFWEHPQWGVRYAVATDPRTQMWTLEMLTEDPRRDVRLAAVETLLTTRDASKAAWDVSEPAAWRLAYDPNPQTRIALAVIAQGLHRGNINRDALLTLLAADPNPAVRAVVADIDHLPATARTALKQAAPIPHDALANPLARQLGIDTSLLTDIRGAIPSSPPAIALPTE